MLFQIRKIGSGLLHINGLLGSTVIFNINLVGNHEVADALII